MSTATQTQTPRITRDNGHVGPSVTALGPRSRDKISAVPFVRLIKVETRKQVDTLAGRWFLVGIAAVTLTVFIIMLFNNGGDHTWMSYFGASVTPLGVLLPVIGIMAATSEWAQRTAMTTFTLEPRRGRTIGAKIISSLLLGAALFLVGLVLSVLIHQVAITTRGIDGDWTLTWWIIGGAALATTIGMLQGTAFGLALLNTPAAIVAYFALPTALTALNALIPSWQTFFSWTDINQTLNPFFMGVAPSDKEWAQIAVSVGIWVVLPMAIGVWRVLRSEVK
ncbi:MAG: ABC transporter permease [Ornithinimicrobium sp.]